MTGTKLSDATIGFEKGKVMKTKLIILVVVIVNLVVLASCSNNEYVNLMNNGIDSLGDKDYRKAAFYFEQALQNKEGDEKATFYFQQAQQMDEAIEAIEHKRFDEAIVLLDSIINDENVLKTLKPKAQNLKEKVLADEKGKEEFEIKKSNVQDLLAKEDFDQAQIEIGYLQQMITENIDSSMDELEVTKLKEQVEIALNKRDEAKKSIEAKKPVEQPKVKVKTIAEDVTYQSYTNGRFGFTLQYPTGYVVDPPPSNDDGRKIHSEDFSILAYGGHTNIISQGETIEDYYYEDLSSIPGEIEYKRLTDKWYVLAYNDNGTSVYKRFYFGKSFHNTFIITYPASKARKYDPITSHISKTFISGAQ